MLSRLSCTDRLLPLPELGQQTSARRQSVVVGLEAGGSLVSSHPERVASCCAQQLVGAMEQLGGAGGAVHSVTGQLTGRRGNGAFRNTALELGWCPVAPLPGVSCVQPATLAFCKPLYAHGVKS